MDICTGVAIGRFSIGGKQRCMSSFHFWAFPVSGFDDDEGIDVGHANRFAMHGNNVSFERKGGLGFEGNGLRS